MPVPIATTEQIAQKWATVTPQRSADYEQGVQNPKTDWKTATNAANAAWKEGTQAAIQANRFSTGVSAAGTDKWQTATLEKGVARWGQGVQLGQGNFVQGFAKFREAIANANLPQRFARRDPRNLERVKAINDALIKAATT